MCGHICLFWVFCFKYICVHDMMFMIWFAPSGQCSPGNCANSVHQMMLLVCSLFIIIIIFKLCTILVCTASYHSAESLPRYRHMHQSIKAFYVKWNRCISLGQLPAKLLHRRWYIYFSCFGRASKFHQEIYTGTRTYAIWFVILWLLYHTTLHINSQGLCVRACVYISRVRKRNERNK